MAQILLADDNQVILQLLRRLIESHAGWEVCAEVTAGQDAVGKAVELKPDLLVLDFAMPGLNGLQVAAQISRSCPTLPIILHTIHDFPEMIAEAKKVGIREVISKSDTADRLLNVMETLLQEKPSAAAAAVASTLISPQPEAAGTEDVIDTRKPPEPN